MLILILNQLAKHFQKYGNAYALLFVLIFSSMAIEAQNLQFVSTGTNSLGLRVVDPSRVVVNFKDSTAAIFMALGSSQSNLNTPPLNFISGDDSGRVWRTAKEYVRLTTTNINNLNDTLNKLWDSINARLRISALTLGLLTGIIGDAYATPSNSIAFTNKTGNISMWANDASYLTSVPAQSFASLTGKPTTIAGYGITDAVNTSRTVTINGSSQDLSANRTWNVGMAAHDKTGLISSNAKLFSDTFTVASATPTISLSSYLTAMGASNFKIISATGYRSGATVSNSPNISVTALTSNTATIDG